MVCSPSWATVASAFAVKPSHEPVTGLDSTFGGGVDRRIQSTQTRPVWDCQSGLPISWDGLGVNGAAYMEYMERLG